VAHLHLPSGLWNETLIRQVFFKEDAGEILNISTGAACKRDIRIWHYEKIGVYIIKSGYKLARKCSMPSSSTGLNNTVSWWKFLWRLSIPTKVKIFIWKGFHGWLLTNEALLKKQVKLSSFGCPVCKSGKETTLHALWLCPFIKIPNLYILLEKILN